MEKRENNKSMILETAKLLFLEKGFRNTSLVELAKITGVGRRTIYRYFDNKEVLIVNVLKGQFDEFNAYLDNLVFVDCTNALGKIERLFDKYFEYFLNKPEMLSLVSMVDVNVSQETKQQAIYLTFINASAEADLILEKLLTEAKREKLIRDSINERIISVTINNSFLTLASRVINHKIDLDKEQNLESTKMLLALKDLIIKGLK